MGPRNFTHTIAGQPGAGAPAPGRSHSRLGRRSLIALASLALTLVAVGIAFAAAGPATPAAPSITSRPADPSNQISAHFTYSDSQPGVSYQCQLDGGSFTACPASGVTYAGPLGQGAHTFRVRALSGTKTSSATSFSWTIDTTPPSVTLSFPENGDTLNASDWTRGCPAHGALCGRAWDRNGVRSVLVSIQQGSGKWWGGSAFDQTGESFRSATVFSAGRDSSDWSYPLALPADGTYTVHVRAIDDAGNTTPASGQTSARFTVDTTAPPAPSITAKPEATTTAKSATFSFGDSEPGVRFQCRRDGGRFSACSSPQSYSSLTLGSHRFEVQALDAVGNTSPASGYSWTIVKTIEESGKPFTITGDASGPLAPGLSRAVAVTVSNPNNVPIIVTSLSVSVAAGSTKAGCDGPANLQLTQSNLSSSNVLTIPANGSLTLPSGSVSAPGVLMRDLTINQDACKSASFTFTYAGSAHS